MADLRTDPDEVIETMASPTSPPVEIRMPGDAPATPGGPV